MKKILFLFLCLVMSACSLTDKVTRIESPVVSGDVTTDESIEFEGFPFAAIVPHDLNKAGEIGKFYQSLKTEVDPTVVFVLGPAYSQDSPADIQTCINCIFSTDSGELTVNQELAKKIVEDGAAAEGDKFFGDEDAIAVQAAFVKKYFPETQIVPVVFKWEISEDKVKNISNWLHKNLPQGALVILSEDFSDYELPLVADFHNRSAFTTINNFDYSNVYDLEIDSPSALYAIMDLAEKRNYMNIQLNDQFVTFFKGSRNELQTEKGISILSFGNMSENDSLYFQTLWNYNPDVEKFLRDIRGREDRFFTGVDFLAFDLSGNNCEIHTQNDLKTAFCSYVENTEGTDEVLDIIVDIEAQNEADLIYVLFKFEGGELDESRKNLMKSFANTGADILIGRGPKTVEPFEFYRDSLIFYSMGDFLIESKLANELRTTSSGLAIGLYATPEEFIIYPYPIDIMNAYPKVKELEARRNFFNYYVQESDLPSGVNIDMENEIITIQR